MRPSQTNSNRLAWLGGSAASRRQGRRVPDKSPVGAARFYGEPYTSPAGRLTDELQKALYEYRFAFRLTRWSIEASGTRDVELSSRTTFARQVLYHPRRRSSGPVKR